MTDKEKIITNLHKALDSLDVTNDLRLVLIQTIEYLQEEPVSEYLEEAAFDYAEACKYEGGEKLLCVEHFKAGAQWQKEQDQSTIELAEDHAMLAGMEKMKEEMMKDTVDGQLENGEDYLRIKCLSTGCQPQDDGKLVKLIIIKED